MEKSHLSKTIAKMVKSQEKKKEVIAYMEEHTPHLLGDVYKSQRIKDCCNVLRFCNYGIGNVDLYTANFCKYDKLCLACATRRAIRKIKHFEKGIVQYGLQEKHWYHVTLTIRHNRSHSLEFLMDRLILLRKRLSQSIRNSRREQQRKKTFFNQFDGMVASIEVAYGKNGWHPHLHVLVCGGMDIETEYSNFLKTQSNKALQREWYDLTGDSYSVGMRKIDVSKKHFDRQGIAEVFKYSVKFTSLEVSQLVELISLQQKKQYRFYATYGIFRGWKVASHGHTKKLSESDVTMASVIGYGDFIYQGDSGGYSFFATNQSTIVDNVTE